MESDGSRVARGRSQQVVGFYVGIVGFSVMFQRSDPPFAYLDLYGAQLMIEEDHDDAWRVGPIEAPRGRGINLQVDVPDVHEVEARFASARIGLFRPLRESWYATSEGSVGQRELLVQDPDGYLLRLVSDLEESGEAVARDVDNVESGQRAHA